MKGIFIITLHELQTHISSRFTWKSEIHQRNPSSCILNACILYCAADSRIPQLITSWECVEDRLIWGRRKKTQVGRRRRQREDFQISRGDVTGSTLSKTGSVFLDQQTDLSQSATDWLPGLNRKGNAKHGIYIIWNQPWHIIKSARLRNLRRRQWCTINIIHTYVMYEFAGLEAEVDDKLFKIRFFMCNWFRFGLFSVAGKPFNTFIFMRMCSNKCMNKKNSIWRIFQLHI